MRYQAVRLAFGGLRVEGLRERLLRLRGRVCKAVAPVVVPKVLFKLRVHDELGGIETTIACTLSLLKYTVELLPGPFYSVKPLAQKVVDVREVQHERC